MPSAPPTPDDDLLDRLSAALAELPVVRLAWLFGSQTTGSARPDSDVDVAVLVDCRQSVDGKPSRDDETVSGIDARRATIWRLAGRLGREVGSHRLDLVLLNDAPPLLRHRVVRDGRLLIERSPEERVRFVRRTIREVQDFQVRREWFLRRRIERLKKGSSLGRPPDLLEKARSVARLLSKVEDVS
ncbi:MAG TPA: nucleotidyltransferase domain-containing protein [Thermoanaerobaculia bacterium]|nr:nucleotidyltransferase domain-containing protein [Thermoanaerobaculia bacterium]